MLGISLNEPVVFEHASLRFFQENEYHITRHCKSDVLLMVFDGVLRFREDGTDQQIGAGTYYIQKAGLLQEGIHPSDRPRYLYVHFRGSWDEDDGNLPLRGTFSVARLMPYMELMDKRAHSRCSYIQKAACFYEILGILQESQRKKTPADEMAQFLEENYLQIDSLKPLCQRFHYSKNHIINLFRQQFGVTPIDYLNGIKLKKAMHLLESTSQSIQEIASACGFSNYSHFYRLFLRHTGQSPARWRKAIFISPAEPVQKLPTAKEVFL